MLKTTPLCVCGVVVGFFFGGVCGGVLLFFVVGVLFCFKQALRDA